MFLVFSFIFFMIMLFSMGLGVVFGMFNLGFNNINNFIGFLFNLVMLLGVCLYGIFVLFYSVYWDMCNLSLVSLWFKFK